MGSCATPSPSVIVTSLARCARHRADLGSTLEAEGGPRRPRDRPPAFGSTAGPGGCDHALPPVDLAQGAADILSACRPTSGWPRPPQAPRPVPRQRHAPDRGGHGARGLLGERVDPLPPASRRAASASSATFEPIEREEWVPDAHAHRHMRTADIEEGGDALSGRQLLMWNDDVEISLCRPTDEMESFYRNGEGDEVIFVHEGSGTLETIFGDLPYREGDYVVIPRGTTYRFASSRAPQRHLVFESPGLIEIPRRYRNEYGQLLEHAPYYHRDIHPPTELQDPPRPRRPRRQGARQATATRRTSSTTTRSTSSAGTATSTRGRSTSTTSSRSPGGSTCRRRRTRPSRAGTSSSARSARASSTSTRWRSRSRTTTRT